MEYYRQGLIAMHRNGSNGHLLVCYYTQRIGEEGNEMLWTRLDSDGQGFIDMESDGYTITHNG